MKPKISNAGIYICKFNYILIIVLRFLAKI